MILILTKTIFYLDILTRGPSCRCFWLNYNKLNMCGRINTFILLAFFGCCVLFGFYALHHINTFMGYFNTSSHLVTFDLQASGRAAEFVANERLTQASISYLKEWRYLVYDIGLVSSGLVLSYVNPILGTGVIWLAMTSNQNVIHSQTINMDNTHFTEVNPAINTKKLGWLGEIVCYGELVCSKN